MATSPATKSATISRILFATDFSPCSDLVLSYAIALAAQFGVPLELLHVLPPNQSATATDVVPRSPFGQRQADVPENPR